MKSPAIQAVYHGLTHDPPGDDPQYWLVTSDRLEEEGNMDAAVLARSYARVLQSLKADDWGEILTGRRKWSVLAPSPNVSRYFMAKSDLWAVYATARANPLGNI